MLVLSRKVDQKIHIGDDVTLVIRKIGGKHVKIAIEAPDHIRIVRGELAPVVNAFQEESVSLAPPCGSTLDADPRCALQSDR